MMKTDKDLIIIGGGSAGLAAAQYGARANLSTLLLEGKAYGGQSLLIYELENYPGFEEAINGYDLTEKMRKQALHFGAELVQETVTKIEKKDGCFFVHSGDKVRSCCSVIIATGAEHRKLNIPGENEFYGKGVSYCATCDGPFFRNKKMLVVGGGDAACDEAMFLSNYTDKIVMIHRRDKLRAQKSLAERVVKNPKIDLRYNTVCKEIKGGEKVSSVVLEEKGGRGEYEEEMEAAFIFIGSIPQTDLVDYLDKDEAGFIKTDQSMASSEPGIFIAGDVRSSPFRQIVVAAAEGAIAAHACSTYIDELRGEAYE